VAGDRAEGINIKLKVEKEAKENSAKTAYLA
jgi:hypothetical protein